MITRKTLMTYIGLGALVLVAGLLAGLAITDWVVMPLVVGKHRGNVRVPKILTLTPYEARQAIDEASLRMEKEGEEYSETMEPDRISSQRPEAETEVKRGRIVYCKISKGTERTRVPALEGKTLRQAMINIKSAGLVSGRIQYENSDSVMLDHVLSSSPAAGVILSRGSGVSLRVSQGPESKESQVPNLVGMSLEESGDLLKTAGLELGEVTYEKKRQLLAGTVISQSVSPGSTALRASTINVTVSTQ